MNWRRSRLWLLGTRACSLGVVAQSPMGTAFTFQGDLHFQGLPASGSYDFELWLYDDEVGGGVIAGPLLEAGIPVADGYFSVTLDFGAAAKASFGRSPLPRLEA